MSKSTTILGYVLLVLGLLLIAFSLYQAYTVFISKSLSNEMFKYEKKQIAESTNPYNVESQVGTAIEKIWPMELIYNVLNLAGFAILLAIFMFGGKQVASIGIQLIKS